MEAIDLLLNIVNTSPDVVAGIPATSPAGLALMAVLLAVAAPVRADTLSVVNAVRKQGCGRSATPAA